MNEKKTQKVYKYTLIDDKKAKKKKAPSEEKPKGLRGLFKKKG